MAAREQLVMVVLLASAALVLGLLLGYPCKMLQQTAEVQGGSSKVLLSWLCSKQGLCTVS
jgi:hypothetical protein